MTDNPFSSLARSDLSLMDDVFELVRDRALHYPDADMGWDETQVADFWALSQQLREASKAAGFWWAVHHCHRYGPVLGRTPQREHAHHPQLVHGVDCPRHAGRWRQGAYHGVRKLAH